MGLEEQKRVIDFRPSWNYTAFEPVAGNYYPVNSFIRIADPSSGSVTVNDDASVQILAEEAVPMEQLDSSVRPYSLSNRFKAFNIF